MLLSPFSCVDTACIHSGWVQLLLFLDGLISPIRGVIQRGVKLEAVRGNEKVKRYIKGDKKNNRALEKKYKSKEP